MKRVGWIAGGVLCWTLFVGLLAVAVPSGDVLCQGPNVIDTPARMEAASATCQRQAAEATAVLAAVHAALPVIWAAGLVAAGALAMYSIWDSGRRFRRA